ncbi:DUF2292 domain-containing protein [Tetragenococcus halophilus]|uniref:DUF2292 domain-containing protein n=1 Tax=Tetragenococcus halophilus TaxID=51669 RepID=UPI003BF4CD4D
MKLDVIKIKSDKKQTQEITVPEFGSVHCVIQDGKVYKVETTESTILNKNK